MSLPGDRLRRGAARVFSTRTMEQVVDPVLADVQTEYQEAVRRGLVWTSQRVRFVGYLTLLKAIAVWGCSDARESIRDWTVDDHCALRRVILVTAGIVSVTTLAAASPALLPTNLRAERSLMFVAAGLPITVPVGLLFGVLIGLRARALSRRLTQAVLALVCVAAIGSCVVSGWVAPAAHRAFRVSLSGNANLPKVPVELTLRELVEQVAADNQQDLIRNAREITSLYETRWALTLGALTLPVFALVIVTQRRGRLVLGVAGCCAALIFYSVLVVAGNTYARAGSLPAFAVAWLPSLEVAALTLALLMLRRRTGGAVVGTPRPTTETTARP